MHRSSLLAAFAVVCLATTAVASLDPLCDGCESRICSYQKSLLCSCTNTSRVVEIVNLGDRKYIDVSLGFAIDDTGSMSKVIDSVKITVQTVVTAASAIFDKLVLATFNDPYVYNLIESNNASVINNFVSRLSAYQGGDCQEMALTGIRDVANRVTTGSAIFVFTDASAKDLELEADVKALLLAKDIRLNVIAVGSLCDSGLESEFVRLTNATNGSIYYTPVQLDVQYVMNYIAKYARYGIRYIRGMPRTLEDLKILTAGNCTCSEGLVRNLKCLPSEATPATLSTGTSSASMQANVTNASPKIKQPLAFPWTVIAIGIVAIVAIVRIFAIFCMTLKCSRSIFQQNV